MRRWPLPANGLQLRHRRLAQRRQSRLCSTPLTKASIDAENFPFCTIEPNTGVGYPVPDPRLERIAEIVEPARVGAKRHGVRGHRRSGGRRLQGRRLGQSIPGAYPRNRCDRPCGALLPGRQRHARRRAGVAAGRHRRDRFGTCAGRFGNSRARPRPQPADRQCRRQRRASAGRDLGPRASWVERRLAGASDRLGGA